MRTRAQLFTCSRAVFPLSSGPRTIVFRQHTLTGYGCAHVLACRRSCSPTLPALKWSTRTTNMLTNVLFNVFADLLTGTDKTRCLSMSREFGGSARSGKLSPMLEESSISPSGTIVRRSWRTVLTIHKRCCPIFSQTEQTVRTTQTVLRARAILPVLLLLRR
jgi:hypothetical protein